MSFARAFSTRRNKPDLEISLPSFMSRTVSQRASKPILRTQISSPMALMSTSNAQILNAQAIAGTTPIEIRSISTSSARSTSSEDSDNSMSSIHSSGTMTDASSVDMSPTEAEPNHLTCYFKPGVNSITRSPSDSSSSPSLDLTPKIPQRSPSRTKRVFPSPKLPQRMLSPPPTREERTSAEIFNQANTSPFVEAPRENPFDKEIAQIDEAAEEFGQVMRDTDTTFMERYDLACFTAADYLSEIQPWIDGMFDDEPSPCDEGGFF